MMIRQQASYSQPTLSHHHHHHQQHHVAFQNDIVDHSSASPVAASNHRFQSNKFFFDSPKHRTSTHQPVSPLPMILCQRRYQNGYIHNMPLTSVCVNPDCLQQNRFIICDACAESDHLTHEKLPMNLLINDILQLSSTPTAAQNQLKQQIDARRVATLHQLESINKSISTTLASLQVEINAVYDSFLNDSILEQYQSTCAAALKQIQNLHLCSSEYILQEQVKSLMHSSSQLCFLSTADIFNSSTNTTSPSEIKHQTIGQLIHSIQYTVAEVLTQKQRVISSLKQPIKSVQLQQQQQSPKPQTIKQFNLASVYEENQSNLRNTIYDSRAIRSKSDHTRYSSNHQYPDQSPNHYQSQQSYSHSKPYQSEQQQNLMLRSVTSSKDQQVAVSSPPSSSKNPNTNFEFSKTMKDPNIKLINQRQIVNGKNDRLHYRVQVLQPDLEGVTPTVKTWSMRIIRQLPHWIGFGMCHINAVKRVNYKYINNEFAFEHEEGKHKQNDHGCYFITTHGWAFAHKQKVRRSQLRFCKDDVVSCKFDPLKKCIIFTKNEDVQNQFAIDFTTECWNKLHPCVIMWYPDDAVELL